MTPTPDHIPAPEAEPDAQVRWQIAERLSVDQLPDMPAPDIEPDKLVRQMVARRLPADRLPAVPGPETEPCADVRRWIAERLPADRLPASMPTPESEPDEYVRQMIATRLPADRLPAVPGPETEPDPYVRKTIASRRTGSPAHPPFSGIVMPRSRNVSPDLHALHALLRARFGAPQEGTTRSVYLARSVVFKVPCNDAGARANEAEEGMLSIQAYPGDALARCRMITVLGIDILVMERLEPANTRQIRARLGAIPDWVYAIDMAQVGFSRAGRLKAYDYGDLMH